MKERLKMIFDRIDIFVVCIVIGLCFCIVEAFLGIWDMFADCFFITLLAAEGCYILRCNEKLKKELIETKEKLKEAKGKVKELQNEVIAEQEKYNHWIEVNGKYFKTVQLCRDLWEERYCLEEAKVLLCKKKLTTRLSRTNKDSRGSNCRYRKQNPPSEHRIQKSPQSALILLHTRKYLS